MLTMLEDNESLYAAMMAGAKGYVLKGADKAEVLKTIRAAAAGEVLFGANIAGQVMDMFRTQASAAPPPMPRPFSDLTDRELEVLTLIAHGHNNHEIAQQLHIAAKTVSNHISNIFNKLDITDRTQAILKARDAGL
jgi:DNA-binding NarL/FixJ family response regulator